MKDYRCDDRYDDKSVLVAYLYDELGADERRGVEAHLERCPACFDEIAGLQGVRTELSGWLPPEPDLGFTIIQKANAVQPANVRKATIVPMPGTHWWSGPVPAWAQAAAAVLVLATGAAIANLHIRYDSAGLTISTGWKAVESAPASAAAVVPASVHTDAAPDQEWRTALTALETELRDEMQTMRHGGAVQTSAPSADAATLKRVQALINESEQRQRQELALRLTQLGRDVEWQRRSDLVRLEQGVGQFQGRTGAEVARQRKVLDYLVRVSGAQVVPE